jgi:fructose-bisphosphate aldolase, class I
MTGTDELGATIASMTQPGKGLLAADESLGTITRRFGALGIDATEDNRRRYRSLLFTAPGAGESISGAILFEETLGQQADDGTPLVQVLEQAAIVPGIKVDRGTVPLAHAPGEIVTEGLDGLGERIDVYRKQGARFAKWRAVFRIGDRTPSPLAIESNAEALARYAAICQERAVVPIVEPEVLMDGNHGIERCAAVTQRVLHIVFDSLYRHRVALEFIVLKPNMVVAGFDAAVQAGSDRVATETMAVLHRTVPAAVPAIMFLSGGQASRQATANLNAMNAACPGAPWRLSFSFGRALQDSAMRAWSGSADNVAAAQQAFVERARLNALACSGRYEPRMEGQGG